MSKKTSSLVLTLLLLLPPVLPQAAAKGKPSLADHLPRDPLLVTMMHEEDLADSFGQLLSFLERFGEEIDPAGIEAGIAEFEQKLGCTVREELLGRIGPQLAFVVDLPPIDQVVAASMGQPAAAVSQALERVGFVARVREAEALDACVRKLFAMGEASIEDEEGLVRVRVPIDESEAATPVDLFYGFRDDVFAIGASSEFVRASLQTREKGQRLEDGTDFARVFSHLDRRPVTAMYMNLPRVRELVESSAMLQGLIGASPEAKQAADMFLGPEFTEIGLGTSAVETDGGTRTTSFGPSTLSGGGLSAGIIAAVAIPNFLNAIDRGKQKRTMADVRSAATATESYAIDNNRYPGPTDGWSPIGEVADFLEPAYIRALPRQDGWEHVLLYWSDGESYRIVSPGKNGEVERDWLLDLEGGPTSTFDDDIVFADGSFIAWPQGKQD